MGVLRGPNYTQLADILQALNRPKDALVYYQKAFDASRDLAVRALGNSDLLEKLALAGKTLGDHANGLARIEASRTSTLTLRPVRDRQRRDYGAAPAVNS